jgi:ankyrin repeat protein
MEVPPSPSPGAWHDLPSLLALIASAWIGAAAENAALTPASRNYDGDTPLHTVIVWGDARAAALLIDAGADIEACGEDDNRPLHLAAAFDQAEILALLLAAGAVAAVRNGFGQTPLDLAKALRHREIVALLEQARSSIR